MLNVLAWSGLIVYLVLSSQYASEQRNAQLCRRVQVTVMDSAERQFITPAMVHGWFASEQWKLVGQELDQINTMKVKQFIDRRGYVLSSRVYTSMDGVLHIELSQRCPILRFNTANGYNFYLTEDHYILPAQRHFVLYLPLVTGVVECPFERGFVGSLDSLAGMDEKKVEKSYRFLVKLINFVKFVDSDDFWKSFVVQIHVDPMMSDPDGDPDVSLVPRAGNQVIVLGSLEDYPEKLEKLMRFYRHAMPYEGWGRYRIINLKYQGQVVCTESDDPQ